jgi:O-antigen/teichoic acid export membrane protein
MVIRSKTARLVEGRASRNLISAIFARAVSVAASAASVPIILNYLGVERFSIYVLITGLAVMLPFADLGLGMNLVTKVAQYRAVHDTRSARRVIAASFSVSSMLSFLLCILLVPAAFHLDWGRLLAVSIVPASELTMAVAVFATTYLIGVPLGLCQRLLMGVGLSHLANLWFGMTTLAGLLATWGATRLGADLTILCALPALVPAVGNALMLFWFFRRHLDLLPGRVDFSPTVAISQVRSASLFAIVALADAANFAIDPYIVSHFLPLSQVADYALTVKVFAQPTLVLSLAVNYLWSDFGKMWASGRYASIRMQLAKSTFVIACLAIAGAVGLYLVFQPLLTLWTNGQVSPPSSIILWTAIWSVVVAGQAPLLLFLNGAGMAGFRATTAVLMACGNVTMSIWLTPRIGVSGPIIASLLSNLLFVVIPSYVRVHRVLDHQKTVRFVEVQ